MTPCWPFKQKKKKLKKFIHSPSPHPPTQNSRRTFCAARLTAVRHERVCFLPRVGRFQCPSPSFSVQINLLNFKGVVQTGSQSAYDSDVVVSVRSPQPLCLSHLSPQASLADVTVEGRLLGVFVTERIHF